MGTGWGLGGRTSEAVHHAKQVSDPSRNQPLIGDWKKIIQVPHRIKNTPLFMSNFSLFKKKKSVLYAEVRVEATTLISTTQSIHSSWAGCLLILTVLPQDWHLSPPPPDSGLGLAPNALTSLGLTKDEVWQYFLTTCACTGFLGGIYSLSRPSGSFLLPVY